MPVRSDRESFQPPTQTHDNVGSRNSNDRDVHQGDSSGSSAPQEPTPLPKLPLLVLSAVIFTEPVTSTILFPFVYFMVRFNFMDLCLNHQAHQMIDSRDFHITENEDEIGFYCGLLASSFFFAQFCTSLFWGHMSDRYGRRPIILIGLCGSATTCILFGLSKSLAWAIVSLSMCGLLNGNVGVAKSMLGELSDQTNQSQALSVFGFAWGMGMIIGPVLGGYLTDPAKNFPDVFGDWDFFINYPYFLPCLAAGMITIIGFIAGYFFLEETKGRAKITRINEDLDHGDQTGTGTLRDSGQESNDAPSFSEDTGRAQSVEVDNEHQPLIGPSASRSDNLRSRPGSSRSIQYGSTTTSPPVSGSKDSNLPDRKVPPLSIKTVVAYAVLALHTTVFEEDADFRPFGLFRISQFLYVATYVSFPIIRAYAVDEEDMETGGQTSRVRYLVLTGLVIKYSCGVFAFTSVMVMITNASPSHLLGTVNGIGQTSASFMRAFGPAIGGSLWAWSLSNGQSFPFNYFLVFILLASSAGFGLFYSLSIPSNLGFKKV
ncbi:hypothetical protein BGX34_010994 [Mortierella sp. NVP85]|nr:hypothetical protein BGX34_010994 [Mortierella sp. NVP85]